MAKHDEFELATARAAVMRDTVPFAVDARYDTENGRIVLTLSGNVGIFFSPGDVAGLEGAEASDLDRIEISPSGYGLHFPKIDADIHVPALLDDLLNWSENAAASLGRRGGESRSKKKISASRLNGRRGGRPKKIQA